jgi:hypothetical protein
MGVEEGIYGSDFSVGRIHLDGLPIKGDVSRLKLSELESRRVGRGEAFVELLDLSLEEDRYKYKVILTKEANSWARILFSERRWFRENSADYPVIYIEWVNYFWELKNE